MKCVKDTIVKDDKKEMKCKLCGKANHTGSKNTAHSWVHSQHCPQCHYLGYRTAYWQGNQYKRQKWKDRKDNPKNKNVLPIGNK